MNKPQMWNRWTLAGKTVSIDGRHGVVVSNPTGFDEHAVTVSIEVCWKLGDVLGEEVATFDLTDLPDSFEVLPER